MSNWSMISPNYTMLDLIRVWMQLADN